MFVRLNDDEFWQWMAGIHKRDASGIGQCLKSLHAYHIDQQYIVELANSNHSKNEKSVMEKLRNCLPINYFNEVHYCISVYSTIMGKLLPPLVSTMEQLAYIEWLQFVEPMHNNYRDHLIHMFKVAFTCDTILSNTAFLETVATKQAESSHFKKWCKIHEIPLDDWKKSSRWHEIIKDAFFIAALFHDIGYGYYHLQEYKQNVCKLYPWLIPTDSIKFDIHSKSIMQSLLAFFIKDYHHWLKLSEINNHEDNVVLGFLRDCLPINHSVASAFFMIELAEKITAARAISPELYTAFHLAAEASMIHDMVDEDRWLYLTPHSLESEKGGKNQKKSWHFINSENQKQIPMAISMIMFDQLSRWNSPKLIAKPDINNVNYTWDNEDTYSDIEIEIVETEKQKSFIIRSKNNGDKLKKVIEKELKCISKTSGSNEIPFLDYDLLVTNSSDQCR
ncbi:MAG: hypothetical protein ACYDGO_11550 [Smithellaceae bacterium]